jgi:DnaJ domain
MGKNYYEILGVPENASDADIDAAFKLKAREVHPDTVPAENAYLRKVASEAFKDLSEAKAALMDPTARQKHDASLANERRENGASSSSQSEASGDGSYSSQHRSHTSSSRSGSSRRSTQSVPSRARTGTSPFPEIRNLNSFLFLVLGMGTIFFLAVLVASGRMPPLWLAVVTAGIGILLFVNGMRPVARAFSSGRPALLGSAGVVACLLFSLWLFSPSYFEMATTSRIARAVVSHTARGHAPHPPSSPQVLADSAPDTVVDESGSEASLPTRVWSNLKDGQTYRSRLDGSSLFLDAIAVGGKIGGQFAGCEFHRTGSDTTGWVGMCTELGSGEALRKMPATLNRFSDDRIEGSTGDIPVFVMTPVESMQMGAGAGAPTRGAAAPGDPAGAPSPSGTSATSAAGAAAPTAGTSSPAGAVAAQPAGAATQDAAEPDLSGLKKSDKEAVELTCASERLSQGPAKYNECLRKQLDTLKAMPNPPSLAGLSSADREDIVLTCSNEKLMHGPGAYNLCLAQQLKKKKHER